MIETTTEYNGMMVSFLDYKIEANGDEYDPVNSLDDLKDGNWGDYCPSLTSQYRNMMPKEFTRSLDGRKLWTADCDGFDCADIKFIIDTIGRDNLPSVFFDNGGVNNQGCSGCWAFNYYYTLAHFINNENYWRL